MATSPDSSRWKGIILTKTPCNRENDALLVMKAIKEYTCKDLKEREDKKECYKVDSFSLKYSTLYFFYIILKYYAIVPFYLHISLITHFLLATACFCQTPLLYEYLLEYRLFDGRFNALKI